MTLIDKQTTTLKVCKAYTSEISKENQQDFSKIKSSPDRIEKVDDDRVLVLYNTDNKGFYCQRVLTLDNDGNLCCKDILIDVILHNAESIDKNFSENDIKKEPKEFQEIIRTMIKGYSLIRLGKEIFSKYTNNEEKILQKYKLAKRIFEDYIEILKESL